MRETGELVLRIRLIAYDYPPLKLAHWSSYYTYN